MCKFDKNYVSGNSRQWYTMGLAQKSRALLYSDLERQASEYELAFISLIR